MDKIVVITNDKEIAVYMQTKSDNITVSYE